MPGPLRRAQTPAEREQERLRLAQEDAERRWQEIYRLWQQIPQPPVPWPEAQGLQVPTVTEQANAFFPFTMNPFAVVPPITPPQAGVDYGYAPAEIQEIPPTPQRLTDRLFGEGEVPLHGMRAYGDGPQGMVQATPATVGGGPYPDRAQGTPAPQERAQREEPQRPGEPRGAMR